MFEQRIKINKDIYQRLLAEDVPEAGESYINFCENLDNLIKITDKYYNKPDKKLEDYDIEGLSVLYKAVLDAGTRALKEGNKFVSDRKAMVQNAVRNAFRDYKALVKLSKEQASLTIKDVKEESRTAKVYLDDQQLKSVSGSTSRRMPVKTKSGTKGFYTERVYNDYVKNCDDLIKHNSAKLPPFMIKELKECVATNWSYITDALDNGGDRIHANDFDIKRSKEITVHFAKKIKFSEEFVDKISSRPEVERAVREIFKGFSTIYSQERMLAVAGIGSESETTVRNVLMYNIAQRLGNGNIVAKSVPMSIVTDTSKSNGVFMENVEGVNYSSASGITDPIFTAKYSGEALKQLAELQMLDYICGNIDRHAGNYVAQIVTNEKGEKVIGGIKGYDNDLSFGDVRKNVKDMVPLDDMKVISDSMAEAVKNADIKELCNYLKSEGLSKNEIEAFSQRFAMVRSMIDCNKIKVIKDEEWQNKTLEDLAVIGTVKNKKGKEITKGMNIYGKLVMERERCENLFKSGRKNVQRNLDFAEEIATTPEKIEKLADSQKLKEIVSKANDIRRLDRLYFPSKEFAAMRDSLYTMENLALKKLQGDEISDEEFKKAGENLAETSQKYISLKKLVPKTDHGKERQAFALELTDMAISVKEKYAASKEMDTAEIKNDEGATI